MAEQNLEFHQGDHWIVALDAKDATGADVPAPEDVEFIIADSRGVAARAAFGTGVVLEDGDALITILPSVTEDVRPGVYTYQARVVLPDQTVSTQAFGSLHVRESLFVKHPT